MNILLVEDNKIKKVSIEHSLYKIDPTTRIRTFGNLADAEHFVEENSDLIDLLILDWCFPESKNGRAKVGAGKDMLDYLSNNHYGIKTVICSGNDLTEEDFEPYHFLLGAVLFGQGNPGEQIHNLYLDYFAKVSHFIHHGGNKPKAKKLVNYDVK